MRSPYLKFLGLSAIVAIFTFFFLWKNGSFYNVGVATFFNSKANKAVPIVPDIEVPKSISAEKEIHIPQAVEASSLEQSAYKLDVFFLKYYGKGKTARSRMIKVGRKSGSSLRSNVRIVLKTLISGPESEEQESGLFTTLPQDLKVSRKFKFKNNVLHLSFNEKLGFGAGSEIIRQRIFQLANSLLNIPEVKGVKLYIHYRPVYSLGVEKFALPDVITKENIGLLYSQNLAYTY